MRNCMRNWMGTVLVGLTACTSQPAPSEQVCTLIGCNDGLRVEVTSTLAQPATVTVRAGNQIIGTFRCEPGQPCATFIENQTPESVSVTVEVSGGTVNRTYTPEYRLARPNGENCTPTCRQATVTVNVS